MFPYSIAQFRHFPKKNFQIFLFSFYMTTLQLDYSFDILSKNDKNLLTNIENSV